MTVGWKTLDVGEKALVYSKNGHARIEEGPQRVFKTMTNYAASQKQYLQVKYKNGKTEHISGPISMHFNEIIHISIQVKDLIPLDANQALIVYKQNNETKTVSRRIQFGPTLFMLEDNEWLHEFSWHGTDPENKTRMISDQHQFKVLKIIPDQFYYNVDEVRTADDAALRVKLMIFFELTDIEMMLNTTNDPMADIVNCLCAGVVAFAAKRTYEEFIDAASELNSLDNYPQLVERSKAIGYSVSKVVFRGYFAHSKLQQMHDVMIKRRTELRLKFEHEVQEQTITDMKLQAEVDRLEQEQELELKKLHHDQKMEKAALLHQLRLEKESHEKAMDQHRQEKKAQLNAKKAADKLEFLHLSRLGHLKVNITDLLVTQAGKPGKLTTIVAGNDAANIYLHYNDMAADPVRRQPQKSTP